MTFLRATAAVSFLVLLAGCVTPQPYPSGGRVDGRPAGEDYTPPPATRGPVDMSGCDRLVTITARNTSEGFAKENDWIARNIPGGRIIGQRASRCGSRNVDIVTVETRDGARRDVFFDITSFFGKTKSGGDIDDMLDG